MTDSERQSALVASIIVALFSLWQPGRLLAGNSLDSGNMVMYVLTPAIGVVGTITAFTTFPFAFLAKLISPYLGTSPAYSLIYGVMGAYIVSSAWFKNITNNVTTHVLIAYLCIYIVMGLIFDYSWRIQDNLIATGQLNPDGFDNMWMAMFFSFSMLLAVVVSGIYCGMNESIRKTRSNTHDR